MNWLTQAWRMTLRDWRAGELRLILSALVVAVAAVTSVGFLADRLELALERDGAQLLGADIVLRTPDAAPASLREAATSRGLQAIDTVLFASMLLAGEDAAQRAQLVSVKAVAEGYPLRGTVRVRDPEGVQAGAAPGADHPAQGIPDPGTVWLEPSLLPLMGVQAGDTVQLGDARFRVSNIITMEPDRGTNFVNLSPRVLMRHDELDSTGLITAGSRVSHRLLIAGEPAAVNDYTAWFQANAQRGQRLETLTSGRPEMRQTLDRARQFLSLVAMLAVLIATVAVAMAARRYMLRHVPGVAVMRCLGATQAQITRQMFIEFLLVALAGSVLGCIVGYLAHLGLLAALGGLINTRLEAASAEPALQGLVTGVWLLLGFALPSLAQLRRVPPGRVLRRDGALPVRRMAFGYAVGACGFVLLLLWVANDLLLGLLTAAGFLLALGVFAVLGWLGLLTLAPLRRLPRLAVSWRFALAGVVRRRAATVAQICALAVGLMAILLLAITRTDLVDGWRSAAPPDAPNRYLINIQPEQRQAVQQHLRQSGIDVELYPVVRGRLAAVNGKALESADFDDRRARRMVERESNLSYAAKEPPHGRVVDGKWFAPESHEVSMDAELSATLGLALGDTLTYDVAGSAVTVKLTSLRAPDWDSMAVNFFVITSPPALREAPQTWITSFHVPPHIEDPLPALIARMPNLSVFDVSAILAQVQGVLDQVIAAVQGLFLFTLAAGVLVLYAALAATRDERMHEAALLRALGATRHQLARAQWLELGMVGAAAGALASAAASVLAWVLARQVFQFDLVAGWWVWAAGVGIGIAAALAGGQAGLRGVLRTPPMVALREI